MDKKAATHVVAFLLFGGAIKMAKNNIYSKTVANYSIIGTKANTMINFSSGMNIGSLANKRKNRYLSVSVIAIVKYNGS